MDPDSARPSTGQHTSDVAPLDAPRAHTPVTDCGTPAARRPLFRDTDELRALVTAFESTALPYEEWTHSAHLAVALWYLVWYGPDAALVRMRDGLRRYNATHAQHPMRVGYHETLTRFWLWVVRRHLRRTPIDRSLAALANDLVGVCTDRDLPFTYYSRDDLMSPEARHAWIEPDLRPLEELPG